MNCTDFLAKLTDYFDGQIEADLLAEVKEHLGSCHHCEVVVNTTRKTIDVYRGNELYEFPDDLSQRLRTAIMSRCEKGERQMLPVKPHDDESPAKFFVWVCRTQSHRIEAIGAAACETLQPEVWTLLSNSPQRRPRQLRLARHPKRHTYNPKAGKAAQIGQGPHEAGFHAHELRHRHSHYPVRHG